MASRKRSGKIDVETSKTSIVDTVKVIIIIIPETVPAKRPPVIYKPPKEDKEAARLRMALELLPSRTNNSDDNNVGPDI